jgi:hypothetical protein
MESLLATTGLTGPGPGTRYVQISIGFMFALRIMGVVGSADGGADEIRAVAPPEKCL